MKVIFWVLLVLLAVLIIFVTGPTVLQLPLLIMDLVDFILYAIVYKAKQWKETIKMLREELFGGVED